MKITFVTAGPIEWASSRLRAFWVADELRKRGYNVATLVNKTDIATQTGDVYIWQKTVNLPFVEIISDVRHYWDVCDPIWWFDPDYTKTVCQKVNGIIFSSEALEKDFREWFSSERGYAVLENSFYTIPDRLNLDHFPIQRTHDETAVTRFIWFGIAANRQALYSALANLERLKANGHNIALTILDDRPDAQFTGVSFPVYHTRWALDTENEVIASHDIALLPPYPGPWGKVKSNNKTLTAWACGLPVTTGDKYDDNLIGLVTDAKQRFNLCNNSIIAYNTYRDWHVSESAEEWESILC